MLGLLLLYSAGGLVGLLFAVFLVLTVYIYYIHWKYSHIPSPKLPSFYLGHIPNILRACKASGNDELPLSDIIHLWYREVGSPVFAVFLFWRVMVITLDPDDIKDVTTQPKNNKPEAFLWFVRNLFGERFLGDGLFSIGHYETWLPRRKIYDSAFNKTYLKSLVPSFNECADKFLEGLRPLADGKTTVPMKAHLAEVTLDVISKVAFASDFTQTWDDKSLGLKRAKGTGKLTFLLSNTFKGLEQSFRSVFPSLYPYLHPLEAEGYRETLRAIRAIGRDCIQKRIRTIQSGQQPPNDILSHILQVVNTGEDVDLELLVDDFITFYVGGQETSCSMLSFVVVLLHLHPDILERLQSEVDEVLGNKETVSAEDLEKLQYTEQVLLETLRMYPPFDRVSRCPCPGGIKVGGYHIPEGTLITMCSGTMCQMPEHFADPDVFNPGRFDPTHQKPSSFVYFPFGLGHRSCIGKHFAMMEAKVLLSKLVQNFTISLPDDYKLVAIARTFTQPKDNVPCTLEFRKQ